MLDLSLIIAEGTIAERVKALDRALFLALRSAEDPDDPLGPLWLESSVRDITALGSTTVLTLITLGALGYLLLVRQRAAALLFGVTVVGAEILYNLLKVLFDRPRPDLVPHATEVMTLSFPSGHATMSAVVFLTLAALHTRFQRTRAASVFIMALAVLIALLVGLSRIYLGVHWPSDVLAGWVLGAAWVFACWKVAQRLRERRA